MIPALILWFSLLPVSPIDVPAPSSTEQEIEAVIRQQLDAFVFNDYGAAYALASKQVKKKFSEDQFAEMIHSDYLQLTKSIRVVFDRINLDADQTHADALVQVTAFNHKVVRTEYQMVHEEGGWKIDAMTILPVRTSDDRSPPQRGETDGPHPLHEIQSVIRRQLDAFKQDDYAGAYRFTSAAFRKEFSRDRFEAMIRARFPEVARSAATRFGRTFLYMDDTRATLEADITGVNARSAPMEYRMVLEEGEWKIDGLSPLDPFRQF